MTANQLAYNRNLEEQRHNRAVEAETARSNLEKERQGRVGLTETNRHNVATETYNYAALAENQRHNIASEKLGYAQLSETMRSNRVRENETKRHNLLTELETSRHNVQDERTKAYSEYWKVENKFTDQEIEAVKAGISLTQARTSLLGTAAQAVRALSFGR